jgi:CBS domain-containing protein
MRPERQRAERIREAGSIRDAWYVLARARTQDAPRPLAVAQEAVFRRYLPMDRDLGKSPARNRRPVDPVDAERATARGLAQARLGWRRPDSGRFEVAARAAIAAAAPADHRRRPRGSPATRWAVGDQRRTVSGPGLGTGRSPPRCMGGDRPRPGLSVKRTATMNGATLDRPVDVAGDVMTRDPDRVAGSDSLIEVAGRMRSLLVAFLPVCDPDGDLQGIIALRDLPRVVRGEDPTEATASSLAQQPAVTIGVNEPVDHVWDLMAERRMWLLPVLDGRRLVGVIRYLTGAGPSTPSVRVAAWCHTPKPSRLTGPSPVDWMRRRVSIPPDHRRGVTAGRQTPHQVSAQIGPPS